MSDSKKVHEITLQYLSQFKYADKSPEEYTAIYLEIYSKISSTLDEHESKIQNELLNDFLSSH